MPLRIDLSQPSAYKETFELGMREGIKEGIEKGIEKGVEKGMKEGKEDVFAKLYQKKFGNCPTVLRRTLQTSSESEVDAFLFRLVSAEKPSDVFE